MEFLRQTGNGISSEDQNGKHPMVTAIEAGVQNPDWRQTGHFMIPYHR
jgi:hypothetical protein